MSERRVTESAARAFAERGRERFGQTYEWRIPMDGLAFAVAFAESVLADSRAENARLLVQVAALREALERLRVLYEGEHDPFDAMRPEWLTRILTDTAAAARECERAIEERTSIALRSAMCDPGLRATLDACDEPWRSVVAERKRRLRIEGAEAMSEQWPPDPFPPPPAAAVVDAKWPAEVVKPEGTDNAS